MSVFNNLLRLHQRFVESNTPTEDFCTECLAGVLNSDPKLIEDFANSVLKIQSETPFKVSTQESYSGRDARIDLVFRSETALCFVEMKVHSLEHNEQLESYNRILSAQPSSVKTYLRYCTLYIDKKDGYDNFYQFRWRDIAKFLEIRVDGNSLIREFHNFLKENRMAGNIGFNHEDLVGLKVYNEIAKKTDEVFKEVNECLVRFGNVQGGLDSLKSQITNHGRLATFCKDVLGDQKTEVLVSFDFSGVRYDGEPVVAVQIYVNEKNQAYKQFFDVAFEHYRDKFEQGKEIFASSKDESGVHIRYEKPLALFFGEEEQLKSIQRWIEVKLDELMEFRRAHPELPWNFEYSK